MGVPFSTFELAVKARKDTSEKGTPTFFLPTEALPLSNQIDRTSQVQRSTLLSHMSQFFFVPRRRLLISTHSLAIRRTILRNFTHFSR